MSNPLGPGDYFGKIALIDDGARSATVTATTDLVCYGLTLWDFRPLVQQNGAISRKLLESLAERLRAAQGGTISPTGTMSPSRAGVTANGISERTQIGSNRTSSFESSWCGSW